MGARHASPLRGGDAAYIATVTLTGVVLRFRWFDLANGVAGGGGGEACLAPTGDAA